MKISCHLIFPYPVELEWPVILYPRYIHSGSVCFYCHGNFIFSVGCAFCFGYCFYQLVGTAFFGFVWFRNFSIFSLFFVFGSANFREVAFLFAVMTFWYSCYAFMICVPISCIAKSFFQSLFWSCSVFSCVCHFVYRFFFDFNFLVWY